MMQHCNIQTESLHKVKGTLQLLYSFINDKRNAGIRAIPTGPLMLFMRHDAGNSIIRMSLHFFFNLNMLRKDFDSNCGICNSYKKRIVFLFRISAMQDLVHIMCIVHNLDFTGRFPLVL